MSEKNKTFLLVSVFGTQTRVEKEGPIQVIQALKSKWQKEPQWKKYYFQVRSPEGYRYIKILPPKDTKNK